MGATRRRVHKELTRRAKYDRFLRRQGCSPAYSRRVAREKFEGEIAFSKLKAPSVMEAFSHLSGDPPMPLWDVVRGRMERKNEATRP